MNKLYVINTIQLLFSSYTLLIFARIIISWIPEWQKYSLVRFVCFCTDPYLNFFKKIIPPLGGVLDISPLLAFFTLRMAEKIILRFFI
jgi:YggT family protein